MFRTLSSLVILFLLPAWPVASQQPASSKGGTLTGVVRFTGTIPAPRKALTGDGAVIELQDLIVDGKTQGLQHVVVILDAPAQPKVKEAKRVVVDQRDMQFMPRVVACQQGQTVRFENNDLCNHSVMGKSIVEENQFNLFAGPNQPVDRVFALQKAPVLIECSIHPWMRAWVHVVPHPYFGVTDKKGLFRIDNIPAGQYKLRFHHADTGKREMREVAIEAGKTAHIQVEWK